MTKKATTKKANAAAKAASTLEERADALLERGGGVEREGKKGRRVTSVAANETDDAPTALTPEAEAGEKPVRKWYAVTVYSGYENKVKVALQERIRQHHMEDKFGEILIPSETVSA